MEVETFGDAADFRQRADPLLLRDEPVNNLILGVTGTAMSEPDAFAGFRGWLVIDSGEPIAAAAQTPPQNLILARSTSDSALGLLATEAGDVPGVVGCVPGVELFVESRSEAAVRTMSQGIFQLDAVVEPPPTRGRSRRARPDELDELIELRFAFEKEAIGRVDDPAMTRRGTEWRVMEQSPRFGLWVHELDGHPVAISGHSGPTPNGIRIGPVYTLPELRGRGYASNLVSTQSQWLLDSGHTYCFLYTDLDNPTSNSIYKRIGYHQIAESAEYRFNPTT